MATSILDAPTRPEYRRRWIREDEMDFYLDRGWARVATKEGDKFKNSFGDAVGNMGSPGKMYLVECPVDTAKKFEFEHQGGRLTELQNQAISSKKSHNNIEGTTISNEEGLPPQAKIRRPERG